MKVPRIILSTIAVIVAVAGTFASTAGRLHGRQIYTKPNAAALCTIKTGCFTGTGVACAVIGGVYLDPICTVVFQGAVHKD